MDTGIAWFLETIPLWTITCIRIGDWIVLMEIWFIKFCMAWYLRIFRPDDNEVRLNSKWFLAFPFDFTHLWELKQFSSHWWEPIWKEVRLCGTSHGIKPAVQLVTWRCLGCIFFTNMQSTPMKYYIPILYFKF